MEKKEEHSKEEDEIDVEELDSLTADFGKKLSSANEEEKKEPKPATGILEQLAEAENAAPTPPNSQSMNADPLFGLFGGTGSDLGLSTDEMKSAGDMFSQLMKDLTSSAGAPPPPPPGSGESAGAPGGTGNPGNPLLGAAAGDPFGGVDDKGLEQMMGSLGALFEKMGDLGGAEGEGAGPPGAASMQQFDEQFMSMMNSLAGGLGGFGPPPGSGEGGAGTGGAEGPSGPQLEEMMKGLSELMGGAGV